MLGFHGFNPPPRSGDTHVILWCVVLAAIVIAACRLARRLSESR